MTTTILDQLKNEHNELKKLFKKAQDCKGFERTDILKEIQLSSETKTIKVLSTPSFQLIGLGFKKDQILENHNTPTPAILIVQDGSVKFNISGKTHVLKGGDFFEIPANTQHEVIGIEDSHLYLIK